MKTYFKDITSRANHFFNILPIDWQEGIVPFWDKYSSTSKIFCLEKEEKIIGGGIIFYQTAPDTLIYANEAKKLFDEGLIYFGFLWIEPEHRGNDLGTFWLSQLKNCFPKTHFWLSIEEFELMHFYEKNGFKLFKEINLPHGKEWIMVSKEFIPPQEQI